ncbi:phosphotransferase enzyme family protein [Paenibacillus sp. FA6]|uniref:phosphotransferase enzyme family protein n=1 Tax=Paenibacillus sp. FA6 TaxID=3413029 RepID=UPI003F65ABEF
MEAMLRMYWPMWSGSIREGVGGWNNTTYFIENKERSSVLRCYDTHRDSEKIEFEHAVLELLQHESLGFKIPVPIKTLTGETIVKVEDGSERFACLFEYIEGVSPKESSAIIAYSFGEVAGELSATLATITPGISPAYRPYYELQNSYPICTREIVFDFCENPSEAFDDLRQELHTLGVAYKEICDSLAGLEKLPQQLVHGDLNESNLLVHGDDTDEVIALLDFEFCTLDVRAMEPAVIISGLLGHKEEIEAVRQFCTGFGNKVSLFPEEIAAIPVLMRLRKIDVFLHFMSRFFEGTDKPEVLREQVQSLVADLNELEMSRTWMEEDLSLLRGTL